MLCYLQSGDRTSLHELDCLGEPVGDVLTPAVDGDDGRRVGAVDSTHPLADLPLLEGDGLAVHVGLGVGPVNIQGHHPDLRHRD